MIPTPIVQEKYRGAFLAEATHAGVAIFADFAVAPVEVMPSDPASMTAETPVTTAPATVPATTAPGSDAPPASTPPTTAAASTTGG
jgi:hypothetical protein